MTRELFVLDEDKTWARARVEELEGAIKELGPEFYEVFNQSSETWHDNAPFDALRDRQSVLDAELQQLRRVLRDSMPALPKEKKGIVGIGSTIVIERKGREYRYFIAGDWTYRAGMAVDDVVIVSAKAPIAEVFTGRRVGASSVFGTLKEIS